jgi:hypothetical protein
MRSLLVPVLGVVLLATLQPAAAEPGIGVASADVQHVRTLPLEVGSVQSMAVRGNRLVVQGRAGLALYDVSDPAEPRLTGRLPLTYRSFEQDLQVSPDGATALMRESGIIGGVDDVLHVFDLRDPAAPREVAALPVQDRSFDCVLACLWAYGSEGTVIDLRDPQRPRVAGTWSGRQQAGPVQEVAPGVVMTTPVKGIFDDRILTFAALDVSDPLNPRVIAQGNSPNVRYSYRAAGWRQGSDGIVLMQALFNGETLFCTSQGPLLAYDASEAARTGRFTPLGRYEVRVGTYADGSPAAVATLACDGYGFQEHPSFQDGGLVVQSHGEHGTRFVHVDGTGQFREVGFFLPFGTLTTDAEWASDRRDERIAYALDAGRGITVLRFTGKLAA